MAKFWLLVISSLEVIGGCFGLYVTVWRLIETPAASLVFLPTLVAATIFAFSAFSGVALWQSRRIGYVGSIIIQAIQLPKLISKLIVFSFSFGFDTYVYWLRAKEFSTLQIDFKPLAFYDLEINTTDAPIGIGFSISAAIFIALLLKYRGGSTNRG